MSRADAWFQADPYPSGFAGKRSFHIATRANSGAADWDRATACHPDLSKIPLKIHSTEGPGTKEDHHLRSCYDGRCERAVGGIKDDFTCRRARLNRTDGRRGDDSGEGRPYSSGRRLRHYTPTAAQLTAPRPPRVIAPITAPVVAARPSSAGLDLCTLARAPSACDSWMRSRISVGEVLQRSKGETWNRCARLRPFRCRSRRRLA